jgi:hypothetical protein
MTLKQNRGYVGPLVVSMVHRCQSDGSEIQPISPSAAIKGRYPSKIEECQLVAARIRMPPNKDEHVASVLLKRRQYEQS